MIEKYALIKKILFIVLIILLITLSIMVFV